MFRVIVSLLLGLLLSQGVVYAEVRENRVILDEDFYWITPQGADQLLARIKKAGFNVFVPCIWHGRGVSWPSMLAPMEPVWQKNYTRGYDPLAGLVKKAHALGIEVHPWFTVSLRQRNFLPQFYDSKTPEKAFNLHLDGYQKFIKELVVEVVENYDVDGINLDYIRTMGICSSNDCVTSYRQITGRDLLQDIDDHKSIKTAAEGIGKWNAVPVSRIVSSISSEVRALKPDLVVSVSSHAGLEALLIQGTDSISWANRGWIDVIFHMDYAPLEKQRKQLLEKAHNSLTISGKLILMVANYERSLLLKNRVWPRDVEEVVKLVEYSQKYGQGKNGTALYEYRFLTDEQIEALRTGPFRLDAIPSWKYKLPSLMEGSKRDSA